MEYLRQSLCKLFSEQGQPLSSQRAGGVVARVRVCARHSHGVPGAGRVGDPAPAKSMTPTEPAACLWNIFSLQTSLTREIEFLPYSPFMIQRYAGSASVSTLWMHTSSAVGCGVALFADASLLSQVSVAVFAGRSTFAFRVRPRRLSKRMLEAQTV